MHARNKKFVMEKRLSGGLGVQSPEANESLSPEARGFPALGDFSTKERIFRLKFLFETCPGNS